MIYLTDVGPTDKDIEYLMSYIRSCVTSKNLESIWLICKLLKRYRVYRALWIIMVLF